MIEKFKKLLIKYSVGICISIVLSAIIYYGGITGISVLNSPVLLISIYCCYFIMLMLKKDNIIVKFSISLLSLIIYYIFYSFYTNIFEIPTYFFGSNPTILFKILFTLFILFISFIINDILIEYRVLSKILDASKKKFLQVVLIFSSVVIILFSVPIIFWAGFKTYDRSVPRPFCNRYADYETVKSKLDEKKDIIIKLKELDKSIEKLEIVPAGSVEYICREKFVINISQYSKYYEEDVQLDKNAIKLFIETFKDSKYNFSNYIVE